MYIQNVFTKGVVSMAKTQAVNFRADSAFYQKTKDILADEKNYGIRCPECST